MNGRWVAVATVVAVAIGVWLRFDALGTKVYGFDETITSLRASGHAMREYERFVGDGQTHTIAELRRFQTADPATTAGATVATLAAEDPQHPPVFYLLERWSAGVVGDSIAGRRVLAAVFSVLAIAAAYWLGAVLLGGATGGCCLAALVAVSPFHVVYAQQAREYSLWALLTLLASAVLLEAQRRANAGWYVAYGVIAAAGLYTDPLFGAVMIAHGVYVVLHARDGGRRGVRPYLAASAGAVLAFGPWLAVIAANHHVISESTRWLAQSLSAKTMLAKWAFGATTMFFDAEYAVPSLLPLALLVLVLEACAVIALSRTRVPARAFIIPLILTTAVLLIVPDLLLHQSRSTAIRYLTPTWIGLQLAVAWLLVQPVPSARARAVRACLFVVLLLAGIASGTVSSRATAWWLDTNDAPLRPFAATIAAENGTIVASADPYYVLEMSNVLPPGTRLRLRRGLSAAGVSGPAFAIGSKAELGTRALDRRERVPVDVALPAGARRFGSGGDDFVVELWRLRR